MRFRPFSVFAWIGTEANEAILTGKGGEEQKDNETTAPGKAIATVAKKKKGKETKKIPDVPRQRQRSLSF